MTATGSEAQEDLNDERMDEAYFHAEDNGMNNEEEKNYLKRREKRGMRLERNMPIRAPGQSCGKNIRRSGRAAMNFDDDEEPDHELRPVSDARPKSRGAKRGKRVNMRFRRSNDSGMREKYGDGTDM